MMLQYDATFNEFRNSEKGEGMPTNNTAVLPGIESISQQFFRGL